MALFLWLAAEVHHRNPDGIPPLIVLTDGERAWHERPGESWPEGVIGILDLFHVLEWLWKVAWCLVAEARPKPAVPWVETDPRRLLEGKEGVVARGTTPEEDSARVEGEMTDDRARGGGRWGAEPSLEEVR